MVLVTLGATLTRRAYPHQNATVRSILIALKIDFRRWCVVRLNDCPATLSHRVRSDDRIVVNRRIEQLPYKGRNRRIVPIPETVARMATRVRCRREVERK